MTFRSKYFLGTIVSLLLIFTLFRFFLYIANTSYFTELSTSQILLSFFDGIFFDLSMIFTFIGLPIFLLNLPIKSKLWMKIISVIISLETLAAILILSGDVIYFGITARHLGEDLLLAANDSDYIIDMAFNKFWYFLILIAASLGFILYLQMKTINKYYFFTKVKWWKEILLQTCIILFIILGIRGTTRNKPINIINAYSGGGVIYGNLVLNGVFTSYHLNRSSENIKHDFYPIDYAIKKATEIVVEKDETVPYPDFPLCRSRTIFLEDSLGIKKPNIVILLLESWTPDFIDSFSDNNYGVTPNFDKLVDDGMAFTNFYANGDRSIHGITGTLLGVPQISGVPYLGIGLEMKYIFETGKVFKENGYTTICAQTSKRGSYRMFAISSGLGFEEYYGMQDFPKIYNYETDQVPNFGWDYEALMFLEKRLSKQQDPFFMFLFTGTTHVPYILPAKKFEKYPHEEMGTNGYLNTLYYSDWSIGEFFKKARKKPWFKNTVFILMADHVSVINEKNLKKMLHIPMLIYAPGFIKPEKKDIIASQSDILPTAFDLAGIKDNYSFLGKSLLRDYKYRYVVSRRGSMTFLIDSNGIIQHDLNKILAYDLNEKADLDTINVLKLMEENLLSIDQSFNYLMKEYRFYKK